MLGPFSSQPFKLGTRHPFGDILQDGNPLDPEAAWELNLGDAGRCLSGVEDERVVPLRDFDTVCGCCGRGSDQTWGENIETILGFSQGRYGSLAIVLHKVVGVREEEREVLPDGAQCVWLIVGSLRGVEL